MINKDYLDTLKERAKKSHVYKKHQLTGLLMAQDLNDPKHKTLYMKMAKYISNQKLMEIVKDIKERKNITQGGAYFMKIAKEKGFINIIKGKPSVRKSKGKKQKNDRGKKQKNLDS